MAHPIIYLTLGIVAACCATVVASWELIAFVFPPTQFDDPLLNRRRPAARYINLNEESISVSVSRSNGRPTYCASPQLCVSAAGTAGSDFYAYEAAAEENY